MKKLVRVSLLVFFIIIMGISSFAQQETKVIVNGETLALEEELIVKEGVIYIAVKDIAPAFNFEVKWSSDSNTANLKNDNMIIGIQANNKWYSKKTKDGKEGTFKFDAATTPRLMNGKLYVPIGNFTIVAGGSVGSDSNKKIYNIIHDWDLKYSTHEKVSVYAGTGKKGEKDGQIKQSQFKYAQSIYTTKDKVTYVSDAGVLRKISNDTVETLKMKPQSIKVTALKGIDNEVYALSAKYKNANKKEVYGIFKIEDHTFTEVHIQDAKEAKILDFDIASNGTLCMLKEEMATGQRYMEIINLKKKFTPIITQVDAAFGCLAASDEKVYLGNKNGSIYGYDMKTNTLTLLAGEDKVHRFKDGTEPLFCYPRKIKYYQGSLYVLDYNLLRKGSISASGTFSSWQTIAGKATGDINPKMSSGPCEKLLLSTVNPIDFAINEGEILITDANQFKVMRIK